MLANTLAEVVARTVNYTLGAVEVDALQQTLPARLAKAEAGRFLDTLPEVEAKALEDTLPDKKAACWTLAYREALVNILGNAQATMWSLALLTSYSTV